jgi:hypothetical protein
MNETVITGNMEILDEAINVHSGTLSGIGETMSMALNNNDVSSEIKNALQQLRDKYLIEMDKLMILKAKYKSITKTNC